MYLLVGSNGFLSLNFQSLLKIKNIRFKTIQSKKIDLTSKSQSKNLSSIKGKFDVVFFSALTPDRGKGYDIFYKNLDMLHNFLMNFNKNSINHFTYISSDAVYSSKESIVSETTPTAPDDLYGLMHLSREEILKDYINSERSLSILRPTLIYGNGDTHNSYGPNRFFRQSQKDKVINIFGKGLDKRDHISVKDVCRAIYKITEKKISGITNVVTGKSYTFKHIAGLVKKYYSNETKINYIKNNNQPSKRKYNPKKIIGILNKTIDLEIGIKNYFKGPKN